MASSLSSTPSRLKLEGWSRACFGPVRPHAPPASRMDHLRPASTRPFLDPLGRLFRLSAAPRSGLFESPLVLIRARLPPGLQTRSSFDRACFSRSAPDVRSLAFSGGPARPSSGPSRAGPDPGRAPPQSDSLAQAASRVIRLRLGLLAQHDLRTEGLEARPSMTLRSVCLGESGAPGSGKGLSTSICWRPRVTTAFFATLLARSPGL